MTPTGAGFPRHDRLTVGAIAAIAALTVIVDHEALGHGAVCLAIGGQVTLLSSSLFRCSAPGAAIDLGGPLLSLTLGLIALTASRTISSRRPGLRLGLLLVAVFAGFWEGGYLVQAMATRQGDLFFAGAAFLGEPSSWWRISGALLGTGLYLGTLVVAARGLAALGDARRLGRIAWVAATATVVATAGLYRGGWGPNLLNAFLEIGLAAAPLLLMPDRGAVWTGAVIAARPAVWIAAAVVILAFAATLGLGVGDPGLA